MWRSDGHFAPAWSGRLRLGSAPERPLAAHSSLDERCLAGCRGVRRRGCRAASDVVADLPSSDRRPAALPGRPCRSASGGPGGRRRRCSCPCLKVRTAWTPIWPSRSKPTQEASTEAVYRSPCLGAPGAVADDNRPEMADQQSRDAPHRACHRTVTGQLLRDSAHESASTVVIRGRRSSRTEFGLPEDLGSSLRRRRGPAGGPAHRATSPRPAS